VSSPLSGAVSKRRACRLSISAGIVPSNTTTYRLGDIQNALKLHTGGIPYLGCGNNGTVLQEVWYFYHVNGTVSCFTRLVGSLVLMNIKERLGNLKALDTAKESSCSSADGINYYERTPTSERDVGVPS
jgi:ribonuclease T2